MIFNNTKKHFYQVKLDQIWLNTAIKQQPQHNKIVDNCDLNLCTFCNKHFNNYLNYKAQEIQLKASTNETLKNKVLRSDSDSSVHVFRKNSFDRLAKERRSLRFKKNNLKK